MRVIFTSEVLGLRYITHVLCTTKDVRTKNIWSYLRLNNKDVKTQNVQAHPQEYMLVPGNFNFMSGKLLMNASTCLGWLLLEKCKNTIDAPWQDYGRRPQHPCRQCWACMRAIDQSCQHSLCHGQGHYACPSLTRRRKGPRRIDTPGNCGRKVKVR